MLSRVPYRGKMINFHLSFIFGIPQSGLIVDQEPHGAPGHGPISALEIYWEWDGADF